MTQVNYGLGWKPSLPDHNDVRLGYVRTSSNPAKADLRPDIDWNAYQQQDMNSCTAHAGASMMRFINKKDGLPFLNPSRMFMYWVERWLEHDIDRDDGATMRAVMQAMAKYGVPDEKDWPYSKKNLYVHPPKNLYASAVQNMVKIYMRVGSTPLELKQCIASGYPFVFGMMVYDSFMSEAVAKTGVVPLPGDKDDAQGGHAVTCVGYDDDRQVYICLNSWGPEWGDGGYFYLPYKFVHSGLAMDFFTIRQMEGVNENRIWKAIE